MTAIIALVLCCIAVACPLLVARLILGAWHALGGSLGSPRYYPCGHCPRAFQSQQEALAHYQTHHHSKPEEALEKGPYR